MNQLKSLRKFFNRIWKVSQCVFAGIIMFSVTYAIIAILVLLWSNPSVFYPEFWTWNTVENYFIPFGLIYCSIFNKLLVVIVVGVSLFPIIWNWLPYLWTERIEKIIGKW